MGWIRIPASLKFDDNSDFYLEFISDLRTDRKLTDLITDLLRIYYEDAQLRELINLKLASSSEFAEVYSQLDKIQMQHNQTMMATSMLANQNKGIIRSLEQDGMLDESMGIKSEPDNQSYTMSFGQQTQPTADQAQQLLHHQQPPQSQPQQQPNDLAGLIARMEAVEKMMPMLTRITELLEGGQSPLTQAVPQQQQVHQQPVSQVQPSIQPVQQEPIVTPIVPVPPVMEPVVEQPQPPQPQVQPQVQPVIEPAPQVVMEQPIITPTEQPVVSAAPTIAPPTVAPQVSSAPVIGDTESAPVEEQTNKPKSFGKAFSSIKKKPS